MLKNTLFILFLLFLAAQVNLAQGQVIDSTSKKTDSLKAKPSKPAGAPATEDTLKKKYINPGKIAGRKAVYKSMIIPGWGQLYNNQLLVEGLNAKGERTGHFWQKTYTLSKIGIIYAGFTLLTLSYIDNTNQYRTFLKEAQVREFNAAQTDLTKREPVNPDLVKYSNAGVLSGKDTAKRNRQIIIFSYVAVYAANIIDAYVAARLHYFNIDDDLSFRISPSMISKPVSLYGFNAAPALKLSLVF